MVQSIFAGGTNYEGQSLAHVLKDINDWINMSTNTLSRFCNDIDILKKNNFWNKIDFNFQCLLSETPIYLERYLDDLNRIKDSIEKDNIKKREVELLHKLGEHATKLNIEYGVTYHNDTRRWKDYGNPDFTIAENLYALGRDYFATLQDAANSSDRLQDYIDESPYIINQNQINQTISNSSNINAVAGGNISNINMSNGSLYDNFEQERKAVVSKINDIKDLDQGIKDYINTLLIDSSIAIKDNDNVKKDACINNFKSFLIGAGTRAKNVLDILSSAVTIAAFLQLQ